MHGGGPLIHKKGGLIHQFGLWLGLNLKIDYIYIYTDLMVKNMCFLLGSHMFKLRRG
jgi:hypothetical protein